MCLARLPLFPLFCLLLNLANSERPNVLFFLADDLGYADFDWLSPSLHTPNLRRLAFSPHSAILSHVYVGPLCSPTRSAMLSGIYPFRTGTQDGVFLHADSGGLSPTISLLPQLLRPLGYRSHLVGKWHLGYCRPQFLPTQRGFDSFFGFYGPQEGYFNHSTDLLDHKADGGRGTLLRGFDLFREENGRSEPEWSAQGRHSTELFTEEAIRVISSSSPSKRPFFLLLSFQAVHAPLEVPSEFVALCPPNLPSTRRLYCGMLAGMDRAIGRVMAHLRAIGQDTKTLVLFGTDNGGDPKFGASNRPLRGGKGQLWEGGIRSTAIAHWPGKIRGGTREDLFHAVDWPATILGAAGLGIGRFGDGLNQWPMLGRAEPGARSEVLIAAQMDGQAQAAIRDRHFKLLLRPPGPPLLFRLATDPGERLDLSRQMPKEVRRLEARLARLSEGPRLANAFGMRTDPRGWPQRHGGTFGGGWC